jgi:hypothetical protein
LPAFSDLTSVSFCKYLEFRVWILSVGGKSGPGYARKKVRELKRKGQKEKEKNKRHIC